MIGQLLLIAALVGCGAAAPGFLHASPIAIPLATSHSSRIDVHSKPILTVAAPIIQAPVIKSFVAAPIIVPAAVSHASSVEVHGAPIVTYGLGGHGLGGLGGHGIGLVGHGLGLGGHYW